MSKKLDERPAGKGYKEEEMKGSRRKNSGRWVTVPSGRGVSGIFDGDGKFHALIAVAGDAADEVVPVGRTEKNSGVATAVGVYHVVCRAALIVTWAHLVHIVQARSIVELYIYMYTHRITMKQWNNGTVIHACLIDKYI